MSLRDYKNASEILTASTPTTGLRFSKNELQLLSPIKFKSNLNLLENNGLNDLSKQKFEFHLYGLDGTYIAGNQASQYVKQINNDNVILDLKEDLNKLGYNGGIFKFVYNFLYDIVGSYNTDKLFISEISPSRKEIKLKLQAPENENSINELESLFRMFLDEKTFYLNLVLNFGQNKIVPIANLASDGSATTIYIKLFDPLPNDISEQTLVWVAREVLSPYIDSVQIDYSFENVNINTIRGPKTDIEDLYWTNLESNFKSWSDLLSSNTNISDKVENYVKAIRFGTELNIDYTLYKNFVFYGSAVERVENFFFKVKLLEYYNGLISTLEQNNINNTSEILSYTNSIKSIVRSFDSFEQFLYYGDPDTFIKTTDQFNSGVVSPFPKGVESISNLIWIEWAQLWTGANIIWEVGGQSGTVRKLLSTSDPEVISWYEYVKSEAITYDEQNESQLLKTIPSHIVEEEANDVYLLFINMIGHYYDNIWVYIENFNKKNSQEHNPDLGKPSELLPAIARQYNWLLSNSNKSKDLWEYFFNLSENDQLKTYENSVPQNKLLPSESTKHVWARIVNNLPDILKSKGSSRSIKALLSTYGIPESILRIKEFGGPGIIKDNVARTIVKKDYPFLNLGSGYSIQVPWNFKENNIKLRWENEWSGSELVWSKSAETASINCVYVNTLPNTLNVNSSMNVFSIGNNAEISVILHQSSSDHSRLTLSFSGSSGIISSSVTTDNIFDGTPLALSLQTDGYYTGSDNNIKYTLYASQEKYNKIVLFESCSVHISGSLTQSYNNTWFTESKFTFGSFTSSISQNHFTGSINEIRFWKKPLPENTIKSHTLSYRSYHGNTIKASYENLLVRIPFWVSSSVFDSAFLSITTDKHFTKTFGTSSIPSASYVFLNDYISPETATIGLQAINPIKERVESSSLLSSLEVDRRREVSSYDLYSNDSNKIKIGFSPQFNIDDDIQNQFGSFELDSYLDIDRVNRKYYSGLNELSKFYASTQLDENPIIKYLNTIQKYDFTIFNQIQQLIPARTNAILGLIIENSILQRIRIKQTPDIAISTSSKQAIKINLNSKAKTVTIQDLNTSVSASKELAIDNVNETPIDLSIAAKTNANIEIKTGVILASDTYIKPKGEYNVKSGIVNSRVQYIKQFSRYIIYPNSIINSAAGFTGSLNRNYNYTVPIDLYLNTRLVQDAIDTEREVGSPADGKNFNFYNKIIYFYTSSIAYENANFYSASTIPTNLGAYPYGKSRGLQNSTFIGTKNSTLAVNQISTQPSLANYSPVFEITGSQLQPVFTYEFNELSGSGTIYTPILPIIPKSIM